MLAAEFSVACEGRWRRTLEIFPARPGAADRLLQRYNRQISGISWNLDAIMAMSCGR